MHVQCARWPRPRPWTVDQRGEHASDHRGFGKGFTEHLDFQMQWGKPRITETVGFAHGMAVKTPLDHRSWLKVDALSLCMKSYCEIFKGVRFEGCLPEADMHDYTHSMHGIFCHLSVPVEAGDAEELLGEINGGNKVKLDGNWKGDWTGAFSRIFLCGFKMQTTISVTKRRLIVTRKVSQSCRHPCTVGYVLSSE